MKRDYWSEEAVSVRLAAADKLASDLEGHPEINQLELQEELRETGQARVYRALLNDAQVIIKRFTTKDAARIVTRAKTELDHLEIVFGDSENQANRCLMALPEIGVIVLSFVPGNRLDSEIDRHSGKERANLLAHAGRWIMKYAEGRTQISTFAPTYWIGKLEALSTDHIRSADDLDLLAQLLEALRRQAKHLGGTAVLKAATHSDFSGMNAHYHEGVLYGVDIQGECQMAMARAVGRFLALQQVHNDVHSGLPRFGINREDWQAFMSGGVLSELEQSTTLPFFIAEQLYARLVSDYHRNRIRASCRSVISSFLSAKWEAV